MDRQPGQDGAAAVYDCEHNSSDPCLSSAQHLDNHELHESTHPGSSQRLAPWKAENRPLTYSSIANANPFTSNDTSGRVSQSPLLPDLPDSFTAAKIRREPPPHLDMARLNMQENSSTDQDRAVHQAHTQHLYHVENIHQPLHMQTVDESHQPQHPQHFHHAQHVQRLQQSQSSQDLLGHLSHQAYNSLLETRLQSVPRMPAFTTSAAEDLATIRNSIAPGDADRLGPIAVSDNGYWMVWQRSPPTKGPGGTWFETRLKVNPACDPRKLCARVHAELIQVCDEAHEDHLIWSYYNLVVSGIDTGRRRLMHETNNPLFNTHSHERYGIANDNSPGTLGRSQTSNSLRPILKSPDRGRSSQDSSRNVMFDLYSPRTEDRRGAPAEVLFKPATRPYQRAAGITSSPQELRHQHVQRQQPYGGGANGWNQHNMGAQPIPGKLQLGTPIHLEDTASRQPLQAPDDAWPKPPNTFSNPHYGSQSQSTLDALPPPLDSARHGTMEPFSALPRFDTDPEKRSALKSPHSSPEKDGSSEHSVTDELLSAFPGRLDGERYDGTQSARASNDMSSFDETPSTRRFEDLSTAPPAKLFGPTGVMSRAQQPSNTCQDGKKESSMKKFAGMANKLIGRKMKEQSVEVVRMVSDAMKRSPSSTTTEPAARESISASSTGSNSANADEPRLPKISMTPGDQMWMLGRVEFILNLTANQFMMTQKEAGRMKLETVAKLTKRWYQKNRPLPTEFMFDLKTQMELTHVNLDTFLFYGPRGSSVMAQASLMQSWRNVVRELYSRTFCLPDHALKKMMVDAFRVLEMLGGDNEAFIEFRDIQRSIADNAAKAAVDKAKEHAKLEHGETRKVVTAPVVSTRGIIDDEDEYYDDGIWKG